MSGSKLRAYSFVLMIVMAAQFLSAQTSKGKTKPSSRAPQAVYVETSIKSWTEGYANWVAGRPDVVQANEKATGVQIILHAPFLDYFASDGKSIYSNNSASANVDFLHGLPQSGKKKPGGEEDDLQPTVSEYLAMFPKLDPYRDKIVSRKSPVLLAICKDDTPSCADQNKALKEFKGRAAALGIQVVEVKLLKNPPGA